MATLNPFQIGIRYSTRRQSASDLPAHRVKHRTLCRAPNDMVAVNFKVISDPLAAGSLQRTLFYVSLRASVAPRYTRTIGKIDRILCMDSRHRYLDTTAVSDVLLLLIGDVGYRYNKRQIYNLVERDI